MAYPIAAAMAAPCTALAKPFASAKRLYSLPHSVKRRSKR